MTWLQEYETLLLNLERAARDSLCLDHDVEVALRDLDRFRERTIKPPPE